MGVLFLILLLLVLATWGMGLARAWGGEPRLSFTSGGLAVVLGVATVLAVMLLPRNAFGELGHGDGMGLIGLMVFGVIGALTGVAALAITVTVFLAGRKRRANSGKE